MLPLWPLTFWDSSLWISIRLFLSVQSSITSSPPLPCLMNSFNQLHQLIKWWMNFTECVYSLGGGALYTSYLCSGCIRSVMSDYRNAPLHVALNCAVILKWTFQACATFKCSSYSLSSWLQQKEFTAHPLISTFSWSSVSSRMTFLILLSVLPSL